MRIDLRLLLRRTVVAGVVVASLVVGAATIRAAGQWTASEAPLAAPPVTVESLSAQLAVERERTAWITSRLEAMASQTVELQAALEVANGQLQKDTATAKALKARIAAAKKKLTALNRQIAALARQAAAARTVVVTRPATTAAPRPTEEPEDDD